MQEELKLQLLNLNSSEDRAIYTNALNFLGEKSPYHSISFISTFSSGLENCLAFVLRSQNTQPLVIMPFYLNPIEEKINDAIYFDVISTYGYGGPLYKQNLSDDILKQFWQLVDEWYSENNVVSEFIRFNLNNNYKAYNGYLKETMQNIRGSLTNVNDIFNHYDRKVRKNINKAEREDILVNIFDSKISEEIIDDFYDVYIETMERTQADKGFFFDKSKIFEYVNSPDQKSIIAIAYFQNKPVSVELILCSDSELFSFIGGTKSEYFSKRPNDLLKHKIIDWAIKQNYKYFTLGGGHGSDDGIFKFKKAFFPNDVVSFYTGRKIINYEVYSKLSNIDLKTNSQIISQTMDNYFPLYNKPEKMKESVSQSGAIEEVTSKEEWNNTLAMMKSYDFYHTFDYHSISTNHKDTPILLKYQSENVCIALPLVLRPIENTDYCDFTSVYGYAGPLSNAPEGYDYQNFKSELLKYLQTKKTVAVFSRLHPYLEQESILKNLGDIVDLGDVVNIDVTLPLEESRRAYSKSNKNQINKLRRQCEVVKASSEAEILEFVDIYYENMRRLNAEDHYFFDKDYFLNFMNITDFKTDILLVKDNETDKFIAGSMFVKTKNIVQFHLSGTRTDFLRLKPSKLFLDEMRIKATEEGFKFFNLGGGLGSEHDSLFEFKSSFSKDFRTFKIWKYIVDKEVYNTLSEGKEETAFFPKYRA